MIAQGHGSNWKCIDDIDKVFQEIVPSIFDKGRVMETIETTVDCFDDEVPVHTQVFSFSDDSELTAKLLIANNPKTENGELFAGYPYVNYKSIIKLKIHEIYEWDNLVEAIITGETKNGEKISFFDTNYFVHKESYKRGEIYDFSIFAIGYEVEMLKDDKVVLEGQQAVDWHAKLGREPTYDTDGNIKPVVIHLNELVYFMSTESDTPYYMAFQSPISSIETLRAFDKDFYKCKITIARDPDIEISLYARADFFDTEPKVNDAIRGIMWLQGKKE
ncbi:MAG: hypothetical protein GXY75_07895 [Bacteroidales bacterium]|jgi:hypothetical protein|nr:hypothetical protein [Bacteroidales bacterium]